MRKLSEINVTVMTELYNYTTKNEYESHLSEMLQKGYQATTLGGEDVLWTTTYSKRKRTFEISFK